jgi:hypothetical protein
MRNSLKLLAGALLVVLIAGCATFGTPVTSAKPSGPCAAVEGMVVEACTDYLAATAARAKFYRDAYSRNPNADNDLKGFYADDALRILEAQVTGWAPNRDKPLVVSYTVSVTGKGRFDPGYARLKTTETWNLTVGGQPLQYPEVGRTHLITMKGVGDGGPAPWVVVTTQ